ncbi:hydrolase [Sphingobium vermicomposti]|uniref:Glutamate carboxypeptidase n=1 Tax=Sphingobium vermicomposti TaxID=529005 RepID=A0A846M2U8_9SPHN|nr:hydrolase [Sphingobium vermicomposti]NIJ15923.1 glutamate carboxypeptidase [Sphingobium vermicomposti]
MTDGDLPLMDIGPDRAVVEAACAAPMLDQVLAWSAINSGSRNLTGLKTVASGLADAFSVLPGEMTMSGAAAVTSVDADGRENAMPLGDNILLTVRPEAPLQLLFTGHMDTVFPADSAFRHCRMDGDLLNGPGVADMKGGIAVMLAALRAFEGSPLHDRIGYQVVLNSDEEIGSPGSAPLLRQAAQGKQAAFTYEPSALPDGTLAGARPGSGNFSIIVTGRSAHAGRNPADGRNALLAAADIALRLEQLVGEGLSVNPARIDGGGPNNVVPDHAILRVNIRPVSAERQQLAEASMAHIIGEVARMRDVSIHIHGGFGRPPKTLDAQALALLDLVSACGRRLAQRIGWRDTGGVCDGNNIAACGVPVVDTMGVRGGAIHSPDEYLIVPSLAERASLTALLLCTLAREGMPRLT